MNSAVQFSAGSINYIVVTTNEYTSKPINFFAVVLG